MTSTFEPGAVQSLLQSSVDSMRFFVDRLPENWAHRRPENLVRGLPETTPDAQFLLAHLVGYEIKLASPVLGAMAEGENGTAAVESGHVSWFRPFVDELAQLPLGQLMDKLEEERAVHIEIVGRFNSDAFNSPLTPLWGVEPNRLECAGWVATKTAQHTIEHVNQIARMALFGPLKNA